MSRTTVPAADEILNLYFPVLDYGEIALIDYMGTDEDIEAAARVSYGKGTRKVNDTKNLIRRLVRDKHDSPQEMCTLKFHLKMPLYVIQQLLRHRTAKLNQASYRYSEIPDEFNKTDPDKWRLQSTDNKQGSSGYVDKWPEDIEFEEYRTGREIKGDSIPYYMPVRIQDDENYGDYLSKLEERLHETSSQIYKSRLRFGVAREQARKDIPVSTYSSLYWKMDLRNLLHFLTLRCDYHAQQEIREYANIMAGIVKRVCPISYQAWVDYSFCSKSFSRLDILFLNYLNEIYKDFDMNEWENCYSTDEGVKHQELGFTKSELKDFWAKLVPYPEPDFELDLSRGIRK
jgi:thymidylate synthase (FAD)